MNDGLSDSSKSEDNLFLLAVKPMLISDGKVYSVLTLKYRESILLFMRLNYNNQV